MPVIGGLEATQQLRKQDCSIPIIALTANAMTQDLEQYMTAGCNAFLAKPIEQQKFYEILDTYLQGSNASIHTSALLTGCDPDDHMLINMVDRFIDGLDQRLLRARQYTNKLDWAALKHEIHDLKGMGGNFGFPQITQLTAIIESKISQQTYDEVHDAMLKLEQLVKRIELGQSKS